MSTIVYCLRNVVIGEPPPQYIIRILPFWYANQQMCIRWGGTYSTSFNVYNGVRQDRIFSPYLFNIYIDDLKCESKCMSGGLLCG